MSLIAYLVPFVTIYGFGDQRFIPLKIFEAIKPARNGIFMDSRCI
jgi:hypothetical protein